MTDNINEISKKTLGSYIKKAKGHYADARSYLDDPRNSALLNPDKKSIRDKAKRWEKNRGKGIDRAVDRLTRESTDLSEAIEFAVDKNLVDFRSFIAEALDKKVAMLFESGPEEDEDFEDQDEFEFDLEDFDIDDLDEEMLEYIAENITEEDFESLDEISKKTLGSYIRKASTDANKQGFKEGANARKGDAIEGRKKAVNRLRGIETASRRLTRESTDLSEISKDTLRRYIHKAATDTMAKSYSSGSTDAKGPTKESAKNLNKAVKRITGINKAAAKLAPETALDIKVPGGKK